MCLDTVDKLEVFSNNSPYLNLSSDLEYKPGNKKSKRHSIAKVLLIDYNTTVKGGMHTWNLQI